MQSLNSVVAGALEDSLQDIGQVFKGSSNDFLKLEYDNWNMFSNIGIVSRFFLSNLISSNSYILYDPSNVKITSCSFKKEAIRVYVNSTGHLFVEWRSEEGTTAIQNTEIHLEISKQRIKLEDKWYVLGIGLTETQFAETQIRINVRDENEWLTEYKSKYSNSYPKFTKNEFLFLGYNMSGILNSIEIKLGTSVSQNPAKEEINSK